LGARKPKGLNMTGKNRPRPPMTEEGEL